jgi:hypothetical protein
MKTHGRLRRDLPTPLSKSLSTHQCIVVALIVFCYSTFVGSWTRLQCNIAKPRISDCLCRMMRMQRYAAGSHQSPTASVCNDYFGSCSRWRVVERCRTKKLSEMSDKLIKGNGETFDYKYLRALN